MLVAVPDQEVGLALPVGLDCALGHRRRAVWTQSYLQALCPPQRPAIPGDGSAPVSGRSMNSGVPLQALSLAC